MKHHFPFYVLGLLMLFGIVLGRVVCGLLCPFGLVQDYLHKIPVPKLKVPKKIDRPARTIKYIVLLVLVIGLPAFAITKTGVTPPYFCKYICPAGTLGGGIPLMIANPALRKLAGALFSWKALVLAMVVAASMLSTARSAGICVPWGRSIPYSTVSAFSRCTWTKASVLAARNVSVPVQWRWRLQSTSTARSVFAVESANPSVPQELLLAALRVEKQRRIW